MKGSLLGATAVGYGDSKEGTEGTGKTAMWKLWTSRTQDGCIEEWCLKFFPTSLGVILLGAKSGLWDVAY